MKLRNLAYTYFLTKPKSIEIVLSSNHEIKKSSLYILLHPWLGQGLLTSFGSKWHADRKLLTPSFHFRILENFIPIFNEQSQILVSKLSQKAGNGRFDIYPYINFCTLDIICETAMGKRIDSQLGQNKEYVDALATVAETVLARGIRVWLLIDWIFELSSYGRKQRECLKILHEFTENVIKERRKEHEARIRPDTNDNEDKTELVYGQKQRKAFLDTLLEVSSKENSLDDLSLREQVDTFMFEGHDTTGVAICWAIYFLGWCPSVQEVAHEEIDQIFGDSDRPVNHEDIGELKYLDAVIKETLRLIPSVHLFGRCLSNDIQVDGYTIPSGAEVFLSPVLVGRNPDVYPNVENFDPMRFLSEDWQKRHPYSFIPFSAGPRNCIGQKFAMMEEKVVLSNILRKFKINCSYALEDLNAAADLVVRPANGLYIELEERSH